MLWFVKTRGWDMGVENLKDQGRCVCVCCFGLGSFREG